MVGAGRDPHIPEVFETLPRERIIHSTEYSSGIAGLDHDAPHRVAVIGGAQSAAEMLWATHQSMPNAECTMIMRSIGLNGYESSKFTNELFYASFVDDFYESRPGARRQLLTEMHRTNYAGLSPGLLENLYRQIYLERLAYRQTVLDFVTALHRQGRLELPHRTHAVRGERGNPPVRRARGQGRVPGLPDRELRRVVRGLRPPQPLRRPRRPALGPRPRQTR